jgi:uncharacterized protein YdiU (UPF0061 family)
MRRKLGLQREEDEDLQLVESLLSWMEYAAADFTNTFRDLSADELPAADQYQQPAFQAWQTQWLQRLAREGKLPAEIRTEMRTVNPAVVPRNHRVEESLAAAEERGELSVLHNLLAVLANPYEATASSAPYQQPSLDCGYRTFCGT